MSDNVEQAMWLAAMGFYETSNIIRHENLFAVRQPMTYNRERFIKACIRNKNDRIKK